MLLMRAGGLQLDYRLKVQLVQCGGETYQGCECAASVTIRIRLLFAVPIFEPLNCIAESFEFIECDLEFSVRHWLHSDSAGIRERLNL
jgi:hypothetical protein